MDGGIDSDHCVNNSQLFYDLGKNENRLDTVLKFELVSLNFLTLWLVAAIAITNFYTLKKSKLFCFVHLLL